MASYTLSLYSLEEAASFKLFTDYDRKSGEKEEKGSDHLPESGTLSWKRDFCV